MNPARRECARKHTRCVSGALLKVPTVVLGGGDRTRTCDILLAKQGLYQLSYAPEWWAYVDSNHRPYAYQAYALTT